MTRVKGKVSSISRKQYMEKGYETAHKARQLVKPIQYKDFSITDLAYLVVTKLPVSPA
jgi:hypothetical protein